MENQEIKNQSCWHLMGRVIRQKLPQTARPQTWLSGAAAASRRSKLADVGDGGLAMRLQKQFYVLSRLENAQAMGPFRDRLAALELQRPLVQARVCGCMGHVDQGERRSVFQ